jgi:hypothetical protein
MDIVEFLEPPEDLVSTNQIGPIAMAKFVRFSILSNGVIRNGKNHQKTKLNLFYFYYIFTIHLRPVWEHNI